MRAGRRGVWAVAAVGLCLLASPARAATPNPLQAPGSGQRISLDLKGVDILDVLKLLSQKTGLNFVAGRNVSGRVTIFVKDVDVWDAFELIVGANDLAYERHGDIITVMMARDYELLFGEKFQERKEQVVHRLRYAKVVQVATVINQVKSAVGRVVADEATNTIVVSDVPQRLGEIRDLLTQLDRPTTSRVFQLNYTDAEKLREKVQDLLSPVGTFTFDARTNTAIVSDLPETVARVEQVVRAFDLPDGQVLIEAKIVKVTLNDDMNFGINWKRVFSGIDVESAVNFDQVTGSVLGGATGGAIQLLTSTADAQVLVEALKTVGKTETLASPRVLALNNQESKILVGKKEAFITVTTTVPSTGNTVNSSEVQFVDVGTKLFVTPNVKRDGHIQMKIRPEVSSAPAADTVTTAEGNRIPIVTTTEAETNVLVQSGATVIIGGLMDRTDSHTTSKIPFLGDLPLVGMAFRGITTEQDKTELVVLLTPQIVTPDGSAYVSPPEPAADVSDEAVVVLQDPVPSGYARKIRGRLKAYLMSQFHAANLPKGSVAVAFILDPNGQLVGEGRITSPEGEAFITAARNALAAAQPFPPFPDGTPSGEVRFQLAVDYEP